jgi:hypothetical protein
MIISACSEDWSMSFRKMTDDFLQIGRQASVFVVMVNVANASANADPKDNPPKKAYYNEI